MNSVSIEKLAAFLDGNLSSEEAHAIEDIISNDASLQAIDNVIDAVDMTLASYTADDIILPYDLSDNAFEIPTIENIPDLESFQDDHSMDFSHPASDRLGDTNESIAIELNNSQSQTKDFNDMASNHSDASLQEGPVIGTPGDEYHQTYADTCAIKSQQIIMNEFGIPCTEDELVQYSIEHGLYHGQGTALMDVGKLLDVADIPYTQMENANVFNIVNELAQGHKVIVGVDSDELWNNDTVCSKFVNWMKDFIQGENPNHALIVAGIDTSDPNNIKVLVTDPGSGDHNKAYPLEQFLDAWSDSRCFMVSTNIPAPGFAEGMENFDMEIGHIDEIAGVSYPDFQIFNDLSMGLPDQVAIEDGNVISPIPSLTEAYFDFAANHIDFSQVFSSDYLFNDYLNCDLVNSHMVSTCKTGFDNIDWMTIQPMGVDMSNGFDRTALVNSGLDFNSFFNDCINQFEALGDFNSMQLCQQQIDIMDYCQCNDIDYSSNFLLN